MNIWKKIFKFNKKIIGTRAGVLESKQTGQGLEIDDFRNYSDGDDTRYINRKLTAKLNSIYINLSQKEQSGKVRIYIDTNLNRIYFQEEIIKTLFDIKNYLSSINCNINLNYYENGTLKKGEIESLNKIFSTIKGKEYLSHIENIIENELDKKDKISTIIISDFLGISNLQIKKINQISETKNLTLIQIDIPVSHGINYNNYILNQNKISSIFRPLSRSATFHKIIF